MKLIKNSLCLLAALPVLSLAAAPGLMVGYIDFTSSSQPTLTAAVQQGYNMIIVGFATVDGTEASFKQLNPDYSANLKAQVSAAKQAGAKVLFTVGGEVNTFTPPADHSAVEAATIANNLYYNLIKPYGFDGIDFDLESGITYDATFIETIITSLKKLDPSVIISGAPQASVWWKNGTGTLTFAPNIWPDLVSSGNFTYIMLQPYNQGGGVQVYTDSGQGLGPTSPGSIAALYDLYLSQHKLATNTQLIIGEPSTTAAGKGLSDPVAIKHDLNCLATQGGACTVYKPTTKYVVPGIMTWSIGQDATNGYKFVNGLKSCVLNHVCS